MVVNVEYVNIEQQKNALKKNVFAVQTSMKNQEALENESLLCFMWSLP
jgi:hypothetical protein